MAKKRKHGVKVSLKSGPKGTKIVDFKPNGGNVIAAKGNNLITLTTVGNLVFTGKGIGFDDPTPFVTFVEDHQILVIDRNQNTSKTPKVYKYWVWVKKKNNNKVYKSPDPLISN